MNKKIIFTLFIAFSIVAVASINIFQPMKMAETDPSWEKTEITDFESSTKQIADFYKGLTKFSVNITHASYKGNTTSVAHEKISGYFKRDGKNYKSYLMGILTVQNEKAKIVIDTTGKTILIATPDSFESSDIVSLEYAQSKKNLKSTTKKTEGKSVRYKMEYTSGKYSSCEILLSEEGAIGEIVFLFRDKYRSDPTDTKSEMISPKAVISYTNLKKNPAIDPSEFDISAYVSIPEKGTPVGVKSYKEYRIVDTRYTFDSSKN